MRISETDEGDAKPIKNVSLQMEKVVGDGTREGAAKELPRYKNKVLEELSAAAAEALAAQAAAKQRPRS